MSEQISSGFLPQDGLCTALGLMSGTSMDGVDAALIKTDGVTVTTHLGGLTLPYPQAFRERLSHLLLSVRAARSREDSMLDHKWIADTERDLTDFHIEAVVQLEEKLGIQADLIGLHGQTLLHRPPVQLGETGWTWQLGDACHMAEKLKRPVVHDFRQNDMLLGGEGAPLAPLYHKALLEQERNSQHVSKRGTDAVLNIGGVANITWVQEGGYCLAFDTGPGNSLMDDWMLLKTGKAFDVGGALAAAGHVDEKLLQVLLSHDYFRRSPPKSLDRLDFSLTKACELGLDTLSVASGCATLAEFTACTIADSLTLLPEIPRAIYVCGGGRLNDHLLQRLRQQSVVRAHQIRIEIAENLGWDGDALEAELFAFLAVRSCKGLPVSLASVTGARADAHGGVLVCPPYIPVPHAGAVNKVSNSEAQDS